MKLILFTCLAVAVAANPILEEPEWVEIDWSKVIPVTEEPGFWEKRNIKFNGIPQSDRNSRIVGG